MTKIAIVIGGAIGNWQDYDQAREMIGHRGHIVIACNHAFRDAPFHVDHAASMHPDLFAAWLEQRRAKGLPDPGKFWGARHRQHRTVVPCEAVESWGGSSGLLCVKVALDLGCSHVILAGVPMHQNAAHYDNPKRWSEARQYWGAWERHLPAMTGRVKSFQGWTFHLLGAPTGEWIDGVKG